jgi:hypothetical protein
LLVVGCWLLVLVVRVVVVVQFFLIVNNANAENDHQQQNNLQQDGYSIAGGFKRAAGELHVIHVGLGLVHLDHLDYGLWILAFALLLLLPGNLIQFLE